MGAWSPNFAVPQSVVTARISYGEAFPEPMCELEPMKASRPRQERFSKAIWTVEAQAQPKNVGVVDSFVGWQPKSPTAVLLALANENEAFQPVVGQRLANGGLRLIKHIGLMDRVKLSDRA
jgi:Mrp family chromosome partitioning ATPase